jgi:DNA processing protein
MPLPAHGRADRAPWLRFALTPGVGPAAVRDLLAAIGLPEDVFGASHATLARVVGPVLAGALLARDDERDAQVERSLDWAGHPEHHLLALIDPAYPPRLLEIGDPPPLLFVRGEPAALSRPALAMVGSRSATQGGLETAQAFARALGRAGLTIVSGLAAGIDAAAHQGALATPAGTVAVLGTGVDVAYPAANAGLADAIVAHRGAIVSEMPLGSEPRKASFPRRNRLIAGLSQGVLVVEAALRSGSLITARQAAECGREVFAIPGSIHSPLAKGCHQLIKQGAKLVESAQDVLAELPGGLFAGAGAGADARPGTADARDTPVLRALGWDPADADTLARRLAGESGHVDAGALAARLLALELAGAVERLPDGRYRRRAARS